MTIDWAILDSDLAETVRDIAFRVRRAGGRALIVGGAVRDALLAAGPVKDVDVEVFGVPPQALRRLLLPDYPFEECGVAFGVMKLRRYAVDIALPRRESLCGSGHRDFFVAADPSLSVAEAASRRDFTVNALYSDPLTGEIEDPYGGIADLSARRLRHVSAKFAEDPLRVLRGMQFVARFGLVAAPETVSMCRQMDWRNLAAERVFEEWSKLLLKGRAISAGLDFLRQTGWLAGYPELAALVGCRQDARWHPEGDVWAHTQLALDAFARHRTGDLRDDLTVGFAVLCHDFGKPLTTTIDHRDGAIRSKGHDTAGLAPAERFLRRMTSDARLIGEVLPLVADHMRPFSMWRDRAGDAAVRRLALRVGRIDRLLRVSEADDEGRAPSVVASGAQGADRRWLADAAARLDVEAHKPRPILLGRHLIARGWQPSPRFKKVLDAVFEAQLDGKFADLDGAIAYLESHFLEK